MTKSNIPIYFSCAGCGWRFVWLPDRPWCFSPASNESCPECNGKEISKRSATLVEVMERRIKEFYSE